MDLSKREIAVLKEVVSIYIRTGEAVASRQVAQQSGLRLSAATLRNVMADLEERQLLCRPHPSAGCLPTDAGLRAYVDSLGRDQVLPAHTRRVLQERLTEMRRELLEDIEWVAKLVADVTRGAGIAVRPMGEEPTLEAVSLVPLGSCRVLGVLVTQEGGVEKHVGALDREVSGEELLTVANYLNQLCKGRTLGSIGQLVADAAQAGAGEADTGEGRLRRLAEEIWQLLFSRDAQAKHTKVLVAGADNLLQTDEFSEVDRVRSALTVLQDHAAIARVWQQGFHAARTQVIIGGESELTSCGRLGMVATLFFCEGRRAGALGTIGPCRMDYLRIVPVVEYIGDTLTRMLEHPGASYA